MRGVNKVIIVGRLGNDPDVRTFNNGGQVTNISVATSEQWTDKNTGERREATEWHRIVFNNRLAEIAAQYLRKGSQVYVEGSLRTRKWQDQSGQERYTTEIRADNLQMLGDARQDGYQSSTMQNMNYPNPNNMGHEMSHANNPNHMANQGNMYNNQHNNANYNRPTPAQQMVNPSAPMAGSDARMQHGNMPPMQTPERNNFNAPSMPNGIPNEPTDEDIPF